MTDRAPAPLDELMEHRSRLLSFVRSRVPDHFEAEDLLQSAFARLAARPDDVPPGHAVPWFYRVLRNAIVDRHRRIEVEQRRRQGWERDPTRVTEAVAPGRLCTCTRAALAGLNPRYARIIEAVDVDGRPVVEVAASEGLTPGAAYVRLHRARRMLEKGLRAICRRCAETACVDCHCKGPTGPA